MRTDSAGQEVIVWDTEYAPRAINPAPLSSGGNNLPRPGGLVAIGTTDIPQSKSGHAMLRLRLSAVTVLHSMGRE
jgi:hypothetical protein